MTSMAVVVGINEYSLETKLDPLQGAVADATDFADWALAMGGVLPKDLYFWTYPAPVDPPQQLQNYLNAGPTKWLTSVHSPDFARAPTAAELRRQIATSARKAVTDGIQRLYVFLAGHGGQAGASTGISAAQHCFIAADYLPNGDADGLVPLDHMLHMLQRQGPPEIVMFLDCCRNNLPPNTCNPGDLWSADNYYQFRRFGRGKAAQASNLAYEVPRHAPTRGAFSQVLINGLRSHRVANRLTLEDLKTYVDEHIKILVKPDVQIPHFTEEPNPPQLVLATGPGGDSHPSLQITFERLPPATPLYLLDGKFQVKAEIDAFSGPIDIALPPGLYALSTRSDKGGIIQVIVHSDLGETRVTI